MTQLLLHDFHKRLGAGFLDVEGAEVVGDYGDVAAEHAALQTAAGIIDLSFRGRVCVTGADRVRFLHGQITNDVKRLSVGEGCYAALVTAKGKMQCDLNLYCLEGELLLDWEPGLTERLTRRLEHYIIADDVQLADVAPLYGLLSVQGPKAGEVLQAASILKVLPVMPASIVTVSDPLLGELYVANQPRLGTSGFDLFLPVASLGAALEKLSANSTSGTRLCGWKAFELGRLQAGIPRFGPDMDETNIPLEAGIESRAVSYSKGCYIGQEVIARIHTYGQVSKALRGLRLADDLACLPTKGDKLLLAEKEVGYITSAGALPGSQVKFALGYVRREANAPGTELVMRTGTGASPARIVALPFVCGDP